MAPVATMTACDTSSASGRCPVHVRGVNSTRIGSTWAPSRVNWRPSVSVVSSGRPWAVLHTAWTMFPTSKRPVQKARWRCTER